MASPVMPLEALGRSVAAALDAREMDRSRAIERAQRGFVEAALRQRKTERRWLHWSGIVGLGFAPAAALALLLMMARAPAPLTFKADGGELGLQTWIAAPGHRSIPLDFSDGTRLQVEAASRVRVVGLDDHGASVALENGALEAEVVHRADSAWRVIAGPITVRVTGTRFAVRWSAPTEEFSLTVTQGSVAVSGSVVGAERPVRAGETLRGSVAEHRLELTSVGEARAEPMQELAEASASAALSDAEPLRAEPPLNDRREPSVAKAAGAQPEPELEWRALARSGALKKAFAAAEESGFDSACRAASPAELLLLGDGARLAGRSDRANQALLTLRKLHSSDPRRAAAAFALGKVAFDQTHAYQQAAEWFRTSLREQPGGSLAREASGRLIEALQRAGDASGARRAASEYLARHPQGPHAEIARAALQ